MRTIHEIELLKEIYDNPYSFIGQRNFNLLYCFMWNNFEKNIEEKNFENKDFAKMPSFREFVENKTSIKLALSENWTWALGFGVEDEKELFLKFYSLLFEYEKAYPIEYSTIVEKDKVILDIDQIKAISERPELFCIRGVSSIRAYIDGAIFFKERAKQILTEEEKKILAFINSYKSQIISGNNFETWDRVLLRKRMNINEFTCGNYPNSWVMSRFFKILEEETQLKLKSWDEIKNHS